MTKVRIEIPNPCHESWDEMTPQEKGRFCATCKKTVRDYTKLSDEQLTAILKNGKSHCGRFRKDQLARDFILEDQMLQWRRAAVWLFPLLLGGGSLAAQSPPTVKEKIELQSETSTKKSIEKTRLGPIKGWVFEIDNTEPLIGTTVLVKGTSKGAVTDIDGSFTLSAEGLSASDILIFSYTGFARKEISIKEFLAKAKKEIYLEQGGVVFIGEIVITSRRSRRKLRKAAKKEKTIRDARERTSPSKRAPNSTIKKIERLLVSPNPFQEYFRVSFHHSSMEKLKLELIDSAGQLIKSQDYKAEVGENNLDWQVSDLPLVAGLYYLRIISKDSGEQQTLTLVYQGK